MGQREAIAFGEGVSTTMRLKFVKLKRSELPGHQDSNESGEKVKREVDLVAVVNRLRNVSDPKTFVAAQGSFLETPVGPPVTPGAPYAPRPPVREAEPQAAPSLRAGMDFRAQ
jgi:hypothetical protein